MPDHSNQFLVWVVIPTYNEADNLEPLATKLLAYPDLQVLIVDDNSPDGTGRLADELHRRWPRLEVLHRPRKSGLGPAYRQGFAYVLERGADMVIQMDADLSHDPALLPILRQALTAADLAIASRYVAGGSMKIDPRRQWISQLGNIYIRLMLGREIHDWSTGYKAWRGPFLRRVMAEPTTGVGYAWLMEMTWLAKHLGGRLAEVPLQFRERRAGQSKFNWRIALEDIRMSWRLHWRQYRRSGIDQPKRN